MRGKMKRLLIAACFLTLGSFGLSVSARADSAGLKFVGGQPFFAVPAGPVTGTAGAPGFAQADWNNLYNNSGSASNLINSSGIATSIGVAWTSPDAWQALNGAAPNQDAQLMNGYLDFTPQVKVTGIPYGTYDVVVYFNGDTPSQGRVNDFQIGSASIFAQDNESFGGTYIQVPSTSNTDLGTSTPAGNFVIFYDVSGSSFTLDATPGSTLPGGTQRATINAIQIVPTPEPQTAGLLLAGLVGLAAISSSLAGSRRRPMNA
jgi:hypothetical protein